MRKLSTLKSIAAPILDSDIDTDTIFPARFLLLLSRDDIGQYAFHGWRNDPKRKTAFVLDQPRYAGAEIVVAGERFGIGSSREHAVWALSDFGIRCIIAPSFGDIFYANCFKNGVLPIRLEGASYEQVKQAALNAGPVTIDLSGQYILVAGAPPIKYDIERAGKLALLNGLDEIDMILAEDAEAINAFERQQREVAPWLWLDGKIGHHD